MRTLLLGATGSVGSAVLDELVSNGHSVVGLARSDTAEQVLRDKGADVVRGDLRVPAGWCAVAREVEAIVHAAATFTADMGAVDRRVVHALVAMATMTPRPIRFVYTGGCWLYGATGDTIATEDTPFHPIHAFAWMVENGHVIQEARCFDGIVLHPALVYHRDGGAFDRFIADAGRGGPIEVWGSLQTRWPLVHRDDLAVAYRLALEAGEPGQSYNVAAQSGVAVGDIVSRLMTRFDLRVPPQVRSVDDVVAEHGDWAVGPTLDQRMSGRKIRDRLGWTPRNMDVLAEIGPADRS